MNFHNEPEFFHCSVCDDVIFTNDVPDDLICDKCAVLTYFDQTLLKRLRSLDESISLLREQLASEEEPLTPTRN